MQKIADKDRATLEGIVGGKMGVQCRLRSGYLCLLSKSRNDEQRRLAMAAETCCDCTASDNCRSPGNYAILLLQPVYG